jgi:hypothetical protein
MAISQRLRYEIFRRDNFQCRYCGAKPPETELRVDHVVPKALGGNDDPTNLTTACHPCNAGKSSMPADAAIVADVSEDALRLSRALKEVDAIRSQELRDREAILNWFEDLWGGWTYGFNKKPIPAPDGFDSVLDFIDKGLAPEQIEHLVGVAMRANHIPPTKTWAYFCGCCWKRIRENVDMAAQIMAAEEGA